VCRAAGLRSEESPVHQCGCNRLEPARTYVLGGSDEIRRRIVDETGEWPVPLPDVGHRLIDQFGVAYVDGLHVCTLAVLGIDLGGGLLQHLDPPAPQMPYCSRTPT